MHKPIVTTDMLECRKYSSVLIGVDHDDFLRQLEHALELREDAAYLALLDRQARENEWSEKTKAILDMLRAEETASSLLDCFVFFIFECFVCRKDHFSEVLFACCLKLWQILKSIGFYLRS